nr:MAG TPA: Head decoration protein [Caudoviricetes sp.]
MSIKIESAVNVNQILFYTDPQVSVGVVVDDAASVTENSRKVVKAGTPLSGDLTARNTAFVKAADTTNPATGVLLHDVDVTDGDNNGTLLVFGFVNLERLDTATAALITEKRKTELAGKVTFLK